MFGCSDRASRVDRLREDPFLCFDDFEGERLLVTGELLCLGGGEWETRCFGGGDGDALRLGGGGGEAVLLFGGGEGAYLLCIGGEYLLGEGERRRGGGEGEGEGSLLVGGGEGLLLRLPLLVIGACHRFPICIRGRVSFWRCRGDGEALREGEYLRRLPTHRSSHGTSWVAHLLRKRRGQNQMKIAGSVLCTGIFAAQNLLQPFCHLYLLLIQITLLF